MKVGLDYWPASTHGPGVGRYLRELVRALGLVEGDHRLRLLDVGPGARSHEARVEDARARRLKARAPRRALAAAAKIGLGADRLLGGCDVFHHVFPGVPGVSRARLTLALAELPREGTDLSRYDAVMTFSRWGADEIARRFAVARERVHALPVGCEHFARDARPRLGPSDPPLVLCLGRLARTRAPALVLAACELLRERGIPCRLSFVGRRGDAYDELRARVTRSPMSASVSFASDPATSDLADTVAEASVLVHTGPPELSAVTPLEAMACGAAVVATRAPALVEALGDEARWIDTAPEATEPRELADRIELALSDARDPRSRRRRLELASEHTWDRNARSTLEVWRGTLGF